MTLTQLFTAIANQIRRIKGTSESIIAEDFPEEMADIEMGELTDEEYIEANEDLDNILENTVVPSGTINITQNGEYNVTNYNEANVNVVSEYNIKVDATKPVAYDMNVGIKNFITEVGDVDTSNLASFTYFFAYCRNLKTIPLLDTSNATTMNNMFNYCTQLTTVPLLDTSNVINGMSAMFSYCSELVSIPEFNTAKLTNANTMFSYCTKLTTVPVLNTSKIEYFSNTFLGCSSLSNESLNNILQMCINAVSYTNTKTLRYIGLTSAQATICQGLSNYQAFLDAGWTTGY